MAAAEGTFMLHALAVSDPSSILSQVVARDKPLGKKTHSISSHGPLTNLMDKKPILYSVETDPLRTLASPEASGRIPPRNGERHVNQRAQ